MTCDQIRRMLSFEPVGTVVPRSPLARRHLIHCSDCRRYWQAMLEVDAALAARPLALPDSPLVAAGPLAWADSERPPRPFSQAGWLLGMAALLCALVAGAYALQRAAAASSMVATTFGRPAAEMAWPSTASRWLSAQGDRVAQVVLAAMVGVLVTLLSAVVGFRASSQPGHDAPPTGDQFPAPRP